MKYRNIARFLFGLSVIFCVGCQPIVESPHSHAQSSESNTIPSDDGNPRNVGNTWTEVFRDDQLLFLSISFTDDKTGIATAASERFLLTSDGGVTWSRHSIRGPKTETETEAYNLVKSAITPSRNIYVLGQLENNGSAIFTSPDFGKTWQIKEYPNVSLNDLSVAGNRVLAVGNNKRSGIVLAVNEAGEWNQVWSGKSGQFLSGIDFVDLKNVWSVGQNGLIICSKDGGSKWVEQENANKQNLLSVSFSDLQNGYTVGIDGLVLKTTDGGKNWLKHSAVYEEYLSQVASRRPDEALTVGSSGAVLLTTNSGGQWRKQIFGIESKANAIGISEKYDWILSDGRIYRSLAG